MSTQFRTAPATQHEVSLRAFMCLRELRTSSDALVALPDATSRCWLANNADTEQSVLMQDRVFAKNNMRRWREATPALPASGARALGLGAAGLPHMSPVLHQGIGMTMRTLARRPDGQAPMRLIQQLLTRLLPAELFGHDLDDGIDEVIDATDLLEQVHGQRQLEAFFGAAAGLDAGPRHPSEEEAIDARLVLHHAFRRSYCPTPLSEGSDQLDAFIAIYRAAIASPAATLGWLCRALAASEELQETIHSALTQEDLQTQGREALRALLLETLRLRPPAWLLVRTATEETLFAGRRLASGDHVLVSPWLRHRDASIWDQPESFDASRFSCGGGHPQRLMLFGQGARKCPAMHFGLQLLACIAEQLVLHFRMIPQGSAAAGAVLWVNYRPSPVNEILLVPRTPGH